MKFKYALFTCTCICISLFCVLTANAFVVTASVKAKQDSIEIIDQNPVDPVNVEEFYFHYYDKYSEI